MKVPISPAPQPPSCNYVRSWHIDKKSGDTSQQGMCKEGLTAYHNPLVCFNCSCLNIQVSIGSSLSPTPSMTRLRGVSLTVFKGVYFVFNKQFMLCMFNPQHLCGLSRDWGVKGWLWRVCRLQVCLEDRRHRFGGEVQPGYQRSVTTITTFCNLKV